MTADSVTPGSTYRLQVQPGFTFADAAAAVPYLAGLGVTHLHLSPVLEAVPGSTHGYDVVDHGRVRAELGGEQGLRDLSRTAREHGLGLVLDLVPNHMAVPAPEHLNARLWAVLRDGPGSPHAPWFDIDWAALDGRVLLPVLGEPLPDALGDLSVVRDKAAGEEVLAYYGHRFPLRPGTHGLPMPELVAAQHYRLAYWRDARTELNYRRFFTISELIAVRVERREVFEGTHGTVLQLLHDGVADGLRIDHPDGLADPAGYLRRLSVASGGRWTVVEKILQRGERLPADWACAGTTGYDALDHIDGLFTDEAGAAEIAAFYRGFTGAADDLGGRWEPTARRAAYRVVGHDLAAEVARLRRAAEQAGTAVPGSMPLRPEHLEAALCELLVRVPAYRPYVPPGGPAPAGDTAMLEHAAEQARRESAPELAAALDFVTDLALGRVVTPASGPFRAGATGPERCTAAEDFTTRFAQVASALHAKSVEDAAFYRYAPLLSWCEVGRDPARPAVAPEEFHAYCDRLRRERPATATVLSTHDTKRSADLRLRLAVLTEMPDAWQDWLEQRAARGAGAAPAPDRHTEYTVFQTAVGLGRCDPDRLLPAVLKAVREAGLRTAWTEQDQAYEKAVADFTAQGPCGGQLHDVEAFVRTLLPHEAANILGAAALHLTMPGVPDVYQGTEGAVYTLVDPDNRGPLEVPSADGPPAPGAERPTGAGRTVAAGGAVPAGGAGGGSGASPSIDRSKRRLTGIALRLRRDHPEWYGPAAGYDPLPAEGPAARHCVAFVRGGGAVTAVTRLSRRLVDAGGWRETVLPLPPGRWQDRLGGGVYEGRVRLAALLAEAPVALLTRT